MKLEKPYLDLKIKSRPLEKWKYIEDTEEHYMVSDHGRIKSVRREVFTFDPRTGKTRSYWKRATIKKQTVLIGNKKTAIRQTKQLSVCLQINKRTKTFSVSTLVGKAFVGVRLPWQVYCKLNKFWWDVRAKNLEIMTDNASTKITHERGAHPLTRKRSATSCKYLFKNLKTNKEYTRAEIKKKYGENVACNIYGYCRNAYRLDNCYWSIVDNPQYIPLKKSIQILSSV